MKCIVFLLLLIGAYSCSDYSEYTPIIEEAGVLEYCDVPDDDGTYQLLELYFSETETITHKVAITYFVNEADKPLSRSYLKERFEFASKFYTPAHRAFEVDTVIYKYGPPIKHPALLSQILRVEAITGEYRPDLRNKFYIEHYDFWNMQYETPGALNIYIYDGEAGDIAGVAGGIGSIYSAIQARYLHPSVKTLEHELGHQLGLFHTHAPDVTNGLNNETGDRICDTHTSVSDLYKYMGDNCDVPDTIVLDIPRECLEVLMANIMSYTVKPCRTSFTPVQIARMKKILEVNYDLRSTILEIRKPSKLDIITKLPKVK